LRVLITGVGGFVGQHLAHHLLATDPDITLHGTVLNEPSPVVDAAVTQHALNLCDSAATHALIAEVQPDHVYHIAAMAAVGRSFDAAWETIENNTRAQLTVLQACAELEKPPRVLIVSSGEIYGPAHLDTLPATESHPFLPTSPYSVSKITQDMLGLQYYLSHHLPVVRVRPFNHTGPGQSEGFVAPDFAMQIARIEAGLQPPQMLVGNLDARRDFLDVRDVVRAYRMIITAGTPGEVYNVAAGETHTMRELLELLLSHSTAAIEVRTDPRRMRPATVPVLWGDATRLRDLTGWKPSIPFSQTLLDVLNDCRQRVLSTN
jgi:GDP-4-dehydro-6-deoxy-D-mannose reductase